MPLAAQPQNFPLKRKTDAELPPPPAPLPPSPPTPSPLTALPLMPTTAAAPSPPPPSQPAQAKCRTGGLSGGGLDLLGHVATLLDVTEARG